MNSLLLGVRTEGLTEEEIVDLLWETIESSEISLKEV